MGVAVKRRRPECGAKHDTRPCRRVGATSCDCCRAIFGTRHPAPERVPPIDNHAYGLWQPKPPPDTSWVTTEDIKEGWPSARRPKQWYPGGGDWPRPTRPSPMRPAEGGIGFWFSAALGVVAFAVFVLALWLA